LACRRPITAEIVADAFNESLTAIKEMTGQVAELHRTLQDVQSAPQTAQHVQKSLAKALTLTEELGDGIDRSVVLIERFFNKARSHIGDRIIQAQEDERHKLVRDIHDGPAQAMANLVMRMAICERLLEANRPEVMQELRQIKMLGQESLREVRHIIFDLHFTSLDTLGLVPGLRRYFENVQGREGDVIRFRVRGTEQDLPQTMSVALFRMIQEAVTNARKHAQASEIQVQMGFGDDHVDVSIKDDGIGFDVHLVEEARAQGQSFGLIGMRERAALLGGEVSVESQPNFGTTVKIHLPMPREE
jgi:two-component system sensor histidine kinase DegS